MKELRHMSSRTITTTDHHEITAWVERHGGIPCRVRGADGRDVVGILRIDFPTEQLEPLDWDHWFEQFEKSNLAFRYHLDTADGDGHTCSTIVHR
ncbi:MAG: hypothetical protein ACTHJM_05300 [Marmoricola sp.]